MPGNNEKGEEMESQPCPVCGEVFYMFPGEVCSATCESIRRETVERWAERAGIRPITFDDLVRIASKIEIPERPSDD